VDFVLTFEEVAALMEAKGITYKDIDDSEQTDFNEASADGRGFAVSGGVAKAVVNQVHATDPDREVKVMAAEGLDDCRAMMKQAVKGAYPGYLLEGMACPGGCIAGPGTLQPINKTKGMVAMYSKRASRQLAADDVNTVDLDDLTVDNTRWIMRVKEAQEEDA